MDHDKARDPVECPASAVAVGGGADNATLEDVVCLQSVVDELRRERETLVKRLQTIESGTREKVQLAESRLREALAQIDALKRAAQTARVRFETEAQAAHRSAEAVDRHAAAAEAAQVVNAELTTALDAAQCRVADLETESMIHQAEIDRLGQEHAAQEERLGGFQAEYAEQQAALTAVRAQHATLETAANALRAERDQLQSSLVTVRQELAEHVTQLQAELRTVCEREAELIRLSDEQRHALEHERAESEMQLRALAERLTGEERARSEIAQQIESVRAAHAVELQAWHETATQREAELVAARDDLARQLEEEQSQTILAREDAATLGERVRGLEAAEHVAIQRFEEAAHELAAAREEWARERDVFESTARQREDENQHALNELRTRFEAEHAAARAHAGALASDRDATLVKAADLEQQLAAAIAEHHRVGADLEAQLAGGATHNATLIARVTQLEEELRQRAIALAQLSAAAEQREQQHAQELQASAEHAHARYAEIQAVHDALGREAKALRGEGTSLHDALATAQTQGQTLRNQLTGLESARDELARRLLAGDAELGVRDTRIAQLVAEAEHAHQRHAAERQSAADAADQREQEQLAQRQQLERDRAAALQHAQQLQAAQQSVEHDLTAARAELAGTHAMLRERDDRIEQLVGEAECLQRQYAAELQAASAAAGVELTSAHAQIEAAQARAHGLEEQLTGHESEGSALQERLAALEADIQARDDRVAQLCAEAEQVREQHVSILRTAGEQAQVREDESRVARENLQRELDAAREESHSRRLSIEAVNTKVRALESQLAERDTVRNSLSERIVMLEDEIRLREGRLQQLSAQVTEDSNTWVEAAAQREAELVAARDQLAAQLEAERAQTAATGQEAANLTSRIHQLQAELRGAQEALSSGDLESRTVRDALARELADARAALDGEHAAREELVAKLRALEEDVAARAVTLDAAREQIETASVVTRQKDEALFAAEQRCAELAGHLEDLQEQTVSALQAQESMGASIAEFEHERGELMVQINQMRALATQLERECERLRRDRPAGEETRRLKVDFARLEAKLKEVEQQHSEAVQRHSAAVAGYMVELNQRSEALHARSLELERVSEELNITRQTCDDAIAQVEAVRQERAEIEQQLTELRAATADSARAATTLERGAPLPPRPAAAKSPIPAAPPSSAAPTAPTAPRTVAKPSGPLTVIHLEENKAFRDPVREMLARLPQSSYLNTLDAPAGAGARLLAINLLNRALDPLAVIGAAVKADSDNEGVFAYCADGSYGFTFGTVDFFLQPIDADGCVTHMLERRGSVQRLLAVSDNVEMTGALREVLSRMRCSTSVAFDSRQAIDLLPMIKPEVVLIDFALPRGEGLRLLARLRSDLKTRALPLAVLLPATPNLAEFRQHALRAAREVPMDPKQLVQSLALRLGIAAATDTQAKGPGLLKTG